LQRASLVREIANQGPPVRGEVAAPKTLAAYRSGSERNRLLQVYKPWTAAYLSCLWDAAKQGCSDAADREQETRMAADLLAGPTLQDRRVLRSQPDEPCRWESRTKVCLCYG
jgi:hypothetical protein